MLTKNKITVGYLLLLILVIIFSKGPILPILMVFGFLGYILFDQNRNNLNREGKESVKYQHDTSEVFVTHETLKGDIETIPSTLKKEYIQQVRGRFETVLQGSLETALLLLREAIPCYTAAIFFIKKHNAFYLRAFNSDSTKVIEGATIEYGKGLVGYIAKDKEHNGKEVFEGNIKRSSTTLYYYNDDEGVHSFMGIPVIIKGRLTGAVVVDSKDYNAFDQRSRISLKDFSHLIAALQNHTYHHMENRVNMVKLAALSSLQEEFFRKSDVKEIVDLLAQILKTSMESSRVTISLLDKDKMDARIHYVYGLDASYYQGLKFSLEDKCLINLVYNSNKTIHRSFRGDIYTPRFSLNEKVNKRIKAILAVPIPSATGGRCIGVMTLESENENQFTHTENDHLKNLALSVGLAIDKIDLLEAQKRLATRDGLTNLPNHRYFKNTFTLELRRAERYKEPLSLILADIDYFKKINDTYGHPCGDAILKKTAEILQSSVRDSVDLAARYGGEEFAILLPKTSMEKAAETAERVRKMIEETKFVIEGGKSLNITISCGVSTFPQNGQNKQDLIKKADNALYRAKDSGRNRVVVCER